MRNKVNIIGEGLAGPFEIIINGAKVNFVQDYDFYNDDGVHKFKIVFLVDSFDFKRKLSEEAIAK